MAGVVVEHAPEQGWQHAPLGMHGLGVHEERFGKMVPLQVTPPTIGKQLPAASQQTPLGPQATSGEHGPGTTMFPGGHGVTFTQMPVAGSQQTVNTQGFGVQEARLGKS